MSNKILMYRQKLIQSGSFLELYHYSKPVKIGHKRKSRPKKIKPAVPVIDKKEEDYTPREEFARQKHDSLFRQKFLREFSVRRTRGKICRLINANPDLNNFLTLTFKENFTDLKEANLIFKKFIKRLKYAYPELKYLAVPEFQKRGAVHYHVLLNLGYVENSELAAIWDQGFVMINTIRHVRNIGLYISKYIGKDLFDKRYFGMRKVLYSRNLDRPKIIVFARSVKEYLLKQATNLKQLFEKSYVSDWQGKIDYWLYQTSP